MIARTLDLLSLAHNAQPRYGVPAFNVIGLEHAEGVIAAAEQEMAPVILQISENAIRYRQGHLGPLAAACQVLASAASVPVAIHLDHITTQEVAEEAVDLGISSIMFDASASNDAINTTRTRTFVGWAGQHGIAVEGEIGTVGGKDPHATRPDRLTDPEAAVAYVRDTGVAFLAVAVGSRHGMTTRTGLLDQARIRAIADRVGRPLVLHGSSGVSDEQLALAVANGIAKVNIATQLNLAYTGVVRTMLAADGQISDPRIYGRPARLAMETRAREILSLLGTGGQALS
jgi:fructose-bisphosphate aldolase, class II